MADICGGYFNISGQASTVTHTTPPNAYSKKLTSLESSEGGAGFVSVSGNVVPWIRVSGATVGTQLTDYTDEDIGSYKYMFEVDTGDSYNNKVLWVASSSIATNTLYLASGMYLNSPMNGYMRRVNVYDVFDGVSKIK